MTDPSMLPNTSTTKKVLLSHLQAYCLWRLAQHKYGWAYSSGHDRRSFDALTRRGLAHTENGGQSYEITEAGAEHLDPEPSPNSEPEEGTNG